MITPKNICQYEIFQFDIYKLREVGITNLTNANQRFNTKSQREAYQKNINEVFKKQIKYILNGNEIDLDEDKSDQDDDNNPYLKKNDKEENKYSNLTSFKKNFVYKRLSFRFILLTIISRYCAACRPVL